MALQSRAGLRGLLCPGGAYRVPLRGELHRTCWRQSHLSAKRLRGQSQALAIDQRGRLSQPLGLCHTTHSTLYKRYHKDKALPSHRQNRR